MKKPQKQRGVAHVPVHGNADHNSAYHCAIGGLVIAWANNESVFLAMLQLLIPSEESKSAAMVWFSHRTTMGRIDLVGRLCRQQLKDKSLAEDISRAIVNFKGFCKTRNFYCHAMYHYDSDRCLAKAVGATMAQEDEPIRFEAKRLDIGALNEIGDAVIRLGEFNRDLWKLVLRLQDALGLRHISLPELLREETSNQADRPYSGEAGEPAAPPKPSEG
jgi:hypothetical protein